MISVYSRFCSDLCKTKRFYTKKNCRN